MVSMGGVVSTPVRICLTVGANSASPAGRTVGLALLKRKGLWRVDIAPRYDSKRLACVAHRCDGWLLSMGNQCEPKRGYGYLVSQERQLSRQPPQPVHRPACRPILAADPARIAQFVEQAEQVGIVHLAGVRLISRRHT